jgi:hypothetical protein
MTEIFGGSAKSVSCHHRSEKAQRNVSCGSSFLDSRHARRMVVGILTRIAIACQ